MSKALLNAGRPGLLLRKFRPAVESNGVLNHFYAAGLK
jgi:hypothetical protein